MNRLTALALVTSCMIGCSRKIHVPAGASVEYENRFLGVKVAVDEPLAGTILSNLDGEPDSAERNTAMGLDTRRHLRVGSRTFQVYGEEVILLDDWGTRTWVIEDVEAQLEALISETLDKPDVVDGE